MMDLVAQSFLLICGCFHTNSTFLAGLQPQNVRINEFVSLQHKKPQWENLETMTENDSEQSLNKLLNSLNSIDNTYAAGLSGGWNCNT